MRTIIWIYLILVAISIILAIIGLNLGGFNIGMILFVTEICYGLFGFGNVNADEVAVLLIWGRAEQNLYPGLYWIPPGIAKVMKFKKTMHNDELPAPPEKIFHGDGAIPDGMLAPIRIKFGQPQDDDSDELKDDPYNHAMVVEVVPVVVWGILDASIFFSKVGSEDNCRQLLTDKAIGVFGDDLSQMTPAKALLKLHEVSQKMENHLRDETSDWGIDLHDAYVKPFGFSHGLNDAVLEVPKAKRLARATEIKADAEKTKRMREGEGDSYTKGLIGEAEARVKALLEELRLKAQAVGLEEIRDKVGKDEAGQFVLWVKTLETAFEKSQYSIIPGSDIFNAASGINEMLNKLKGVKP